MTKAKERVCLECGKPLGPLASNSVSQLCTSCWWQTRGWESVRKKPLARPLSGGLPKEYNP